MHTTSTCWEILTAKLLLPSHDRTNRCSVVGFSKWSVTSSSVWKSTYLNSDHHLCPFDKKKANLTVNLASGCTSSWPGWVNNNLRKCKKVDGETLMSSQLYLTGAVYSLDGSDSLKETMQTSIAADDRVRVRCFDQWSHWWLEEKQMCVWSCVFFVCVPAHTKLYIVNVRDRA